VGMVWGEDLQSLRHGDDLFDTDPGTSNLRMTTFARERLAIDFLSQRLPRSYVSMDSPSLGVALLLLR